MHGRKLFELAKMVGLTQSAVARHFRINRVQVHYWAQGHRAIPTHYLEPLMELVFQAVKTFFLLGQADTEAAWGDTPTLGRLGLYGGESPLRRQITTMLDECIEENMELRGVGPSSSVNALAAEIGTYATMPAWTLRKPEHARRLLELSVDLQVATEMVLRLGRLIDLVEDTTVPQASTSTEPAA